ncbi:FimV/HubP family polar landmark protein [Litorilituus sediminis]|uniref:LysM domain-containing protein n=1 Tax=Litorilituus sediminis TaxID=718192 RepID=A0A4V0ZGH9_9GAMM|nr:FimV/HubP family polar landmark protein [Litorilituus sediminis]QBG37360.1 hypothetical protein EMK97_17245 [Litorilituus sediminis]
MVVQKKLSVFILLSALFSASSFAKIKHISLHEIESSGEQALSIKLNIVEQRAKPIKFTLVSQNAEWPLEFKRLNDYMLRIKGSMALKLPARINVYEKNSSQWLKVKEVPLSKERATLASDKTIISSAIKPNDNFATTSIKNDIPPVVTQTGINAQKQQCLLTRKNNNETLWSIASRYKLEWSTDVYSAMIAIYQSNLAQFNNQHISQLKSGALLVCPNPQSLAKLGGKKQMQQKFNALNNRK